MITELQEVLNGLPKEAKMELHVTASTASLVVKLDHAHGVAAENVTDSNLRMEASWMAKILTQGNLDR